MSPAILANLHITAVQWALATAVEGEAHQSITDRASAYVAFVTKAANEQVASAMRERQVATIN